MMDPALDGTAATPADFDALFRAHERFLWGVAYRMTGSAAEADDVVQQTFARAMESPPQRVSNGAGEVATWRPWLSRVCINLARDALRRRRRQAYEGPWLPSPIDTGDEASADLPEKPADSAEAKYDLLESVTFAFLLALEALTSKQRAVLLLCDVFGHSVREVGELLEMSEGAVKTTHHRARAAMRAYDVSRTVPTRALQDKTRQALERFLGAVARQDYDAVAAALADDVRAVSDGAGEFSAARVWIVGSEKVARFFLAVGKRAERGVRFEVRSLNGLPALVLAFEHPRGKEAPLVTQGCDVDAQGRVRVLYTVLATKKLGRVRSSSVDVSADRSP